MQSYFKNCLAGMLIIEHGKFRRRNRQTRGKSVNFRNIRVLRVLFQLLSSVAIKQVAQSAEYAALFSPVNGSVGEDTACQTAYR